jgi:arabinofuranosyltransferase
MRAPALRPSALTRISLWFTVAAVSVLWFWGAWQRRWIADDGLIVLRTIRNLLAGNGPVFNAGERVESNTSTAWTYLVYLGSVVGGPLRLEYVALALSLIFSVAGVAMAMLGTARLWAPYLRARPAVFLPAGVLVYIAIPPARDFATSGLENGLVTAWLGGLWWLMVRWAQSPQHSGSNPAGLAGLAFVAGLSVLVRPELALIGGVALIMMLIAEPAWGRRALIVLAGGLLPVGYQIFRMGYYALIVPQTALAKDASGSKWGQGLTYLNNLTGPYALWLPAVLVIGLVAVLRAGRTPGEQPERARATGLAARVRTSSAVVVFILLSGVLQALYWIRQGGDFMHGRVLLAPLFCVLLPFAVIPLVIPPGFRIADLAKGIPRENSHRLAGAALLLWLALAGWALWAANSPGMGRDATRVTYSGIVDERRFYSQATGHAHPLTAADYLDYPRMRAVLVAINNTPDGALLLPSGNWDVWDVVPQKPPTEPPPPGVSAEDWRRQNATHTVFFTNLGMLGMNVGLDTRVIDQIGLANPLAAHTARLADGRIGHDKNLFPDWAVAEGPWLKERPWIPEYLDEGWVEQAQVALGCPDTVEMFTAIREPMTRPRFIGNFNRAWDFTRYRIDRVPRYELLRCGLPEPPTDRPDYTGLPATGP